MHPDFVFFNEVDGKMRPSIVDPHGHHLEDSLVKLQGLAKFAEDVRRRRSTGSRPLANLDRR